MKLKFNATEEQKACLVQILRPYIKHVSKPYDGHGEGLYRYYIDISFCKQMTEVHKQNCLKPHEIAEHF